MFSMDIIDSDDFLELPMSSQNLYFHLSMRADDDGFITPKKIMRMIGAKEDDLKILLAKRFLLSFESGVVVIKHWLIHNTIRKDRYVETNYRIEKGLLNKKENKAYTLDKNKGKPVVSIMATKVATTGSPSIEENSIVKNSNSIDIDNNIKKKFNFKKTLIDWSKQYFYEDVDENVLSEWLEVRRKKKAVNSETALKGFMREVKKSKKSVNEVLQTCVENSWKGFKAEWLNNTMNDIGKKKKITII